MGSACKKNRGKRNAFKILIGKPEGRRPLGRQRRVWVDNIKDNFREIGWNGMNWISAAQDKDQERAFVTKVMNLRVS
jgi:hypothetical protein